MLNHSNAVRVNQTTVPTTAKHGQQRRLRQIELNDTSILFHGELGVQILCLRQAFPKWRVSKALLT